MKPWHLGLLILQGSNLSGNPCLLGSFKVGKHALVARKELVALLIKEVLIAVALAAA